ncbi:MAG TPA: zinc-binding dehydrogenase [Trinickia sp.]
MLISSGARGRIATIAEFGIESRHGHSGTFVFFSDAKRFLPEAIRLFQDDQLQIVIDTVYAPNETVEARQTLAAGHACGKIVIRTINEP